MESTEYIKQYLYFKEKCVEQKIIDIDEIIKLFEAWKKSF